MFRKRKVRQGLITIKKIAKIVSTTAALVLLGMAIYEKVTR